MDESKICIQCGSRIDDGLIFCQKCGAGERSPVSLIQSSADDVKPNKVNLITRIVVTVVRGIAGIAAVVAIFCPFGTWTQILIFMGSVVVLLICHFVLAHLDDNYVAEQVKDAYWTSKPMNWTPLPDRNDRDERTQR